jgi:hypothetical protein
MLPPRRVNGNGEQCGVRGRFVPRTLAAPEVALAAVPGACRVPRVLQLFVDILLLRAGPQDVPASSVLLALAVLASASASWLLALEAFAGPHAFARVAVELGLMAGLLLALLGFHGRGTRFPQTFTALCGTGAMLALLAWPLFGIALGRPRGDEFGALAMLMLWVIYAWNIVVIGHILRHALDSGLARGILLALAFALLVAGAGEWLVPAPETH